MAEVIFKTIGKKGAAFFLNTGRNGQLAAQVEGHGFTAIRHCPNEGSIVLNKQSEFATPAPLIFEDGKLVVDTNKKHTIDFLEAHPSKGVLFEKHEPSKEAERSNDLEELVLVVKASIFSTAKLNGGETRLRSVAGALMGKTITKDEMGDSEIKGWLLSQAAQFPEKYTDKNSKGKVVSTMFTDTITVNKQTILALIKSGDLVVDSSDRGIMHAGSTAALFTCGVGLSVIPEFAIHLSKPENKALLAELKGKL